VPVAGCAAGAALQRDGATGPARVLSTMVKLPSAFATGNPA
jgi:hypothetical protein